MNLLRRLTLRSILLFDACASGALGLLMLVAANQLEDLLGLPDSLLRVTGIALIRGWHC